MTVLFGGQFEAEVFGDTWEWDGIFWTQVADIGPKSRVGHTLSYDTVRRRCVLFGGIAGGTLADTWAWDGSYWIQLAGPGPAGRSYHATAFDSVRKRLVLFGGLEQGGGLRRDTWEHDGLEWVQVDDAGPAPRSSHCMAFDSVAEKVLLFGGDTVSGAASDTWAWDGERWVEVAHLGPSPRGGATWAGWGSALVLHGGRTSSADAEGSVLADTWQWTKGQWMQLQDFGPAARGFHGLVTDGPRCIEHERC
ncbi:Kelch repeat-containing protein [Streptomyces sp. NBC_01361]|uniref:Kelch repeat-containing protein n=1 Tax=Streptomyces sp. NBC_01361 TaxID=2903838 RepID=UPI002E3452C5|nr:hypothetical protein [Streptomyces sp. NBC_01361]